MDDALTVVLSTAPLRGGGHLLLLREAYIFDACGERREVRWLLSETKKVEHGKSI